MKKKIIERKIVATYARVSTRKQDMQQQDKVLRGWSKGFDDCFEYNDLAISGRKDQRAGIMQLLEDARAHKFDLVGVVEISRIGRSISFIHRVIEELSKLNINIVLINTNTILNYNTLEGRALIGGLSLAADIEWMLISERNARGRQKIMDENIKVGRKQQEISLDAIKALQEKGLSMRKIAGELNTSPQTIMRRLRV